MVQPWIELSELENPSDPYAEMAIDSATLILWSLSGRRYSGVTTVTEQYVCSQYDVPAGCVWEDSGRFVNQYGYMSYVTPSLNLPTVQRYGARIRLRQQPVRKILSVSIGDQVLPSGSYHIRNHSELVIESSFCGSICDGPEITYIYGVKPPSLGRLAAIELANEYIKYYNGEACALPERVTSVSRKGLNIELYDPGDFLDNGKIGLPRSDQFVSVVNPGKSKKPARVFSVDKPKGFTKI